MAPANNPNAPEGPNGPRIRGNIVNEGELQRKMAAYPVDFRSAHGEPLYEDEEFAVFLDESGDEMMIISEKYGFDPKDVLAYMTMKCRELGVGIPMQEGWPLVVRKATGENTDSDTGEDTEVN